jgi:hypothetical protein
LEACLDATGFDGTILATIVIILLLYDDDIVLMEMNAYDLTKNLHILNDFFSNT